MARRALISGVTGFVGKRLGAALRGDGFEACGLTRDPARAMRELPFLHAAFAWKALEDDRREDVLRGVDAIVHLAGESVAGLWTAAKRERIEKSRIDGTRAIVNALAAVEQRPRVLVSASAVGYYGDPGDDVELTEEHPAGEGFLARVCVGWEREAARAEELGVRVVRLRIGLVLGREGGTLGAMLPMFKAGLGGSIGSGRQLWPWIHIDDLIAMIRRAIEDDGWSGAYNATAPHPVPQREFAKTLASIVHRPAFLPAPALVLKGVLGGFASEMLVSRCAVPRRAIDSGFSFRFTELEPALRDLL